MTHKLQIWVVTGGHPFNRRRFAEMFASFENIDAIWLSQPAAAAQLNPTNAKSIDAVVFYDMPGIEVSNGDIRFSDHPCPAQFVALLRQGIGCVFLHHAIAAWPTWNDYAEIVGGRFLFRPDTLRGKALPDSGFAPAVTHHVYITDKAHPVVRGVEDGFTVADEAYLCTVFEDSVTPLLRSDRHFTDEEFFSAAESAKSGQATRAGWSHPAGSNLLAWTKAAYSSPVIYLQLGDGPATYENENFRKLVANAIAWSASEEAHKWAKENSGG